MQIKLLSLAFAALALVSAHYDEHTTTTYVGHHPEPTTVVVPPPHHHSPTPVPPPVKPTPSPKPKPKKPAPVAKPPVCGGNTIAACCQTDNQPITKRSVIVVGSVNCQSPGDPTSIKKFQNICSQTGRTAECCETLVDGVGTGCQDV